MNTRVQELEEELKVICLGANICSMYLVYQQSLQFYLQHLYCGDSNLGVYLFVCLRIQNYLQIPQLFHLFLRWVQLLSSVAYGTLWLLFSLRLTIIYLFLAIQ